MDWIKDNYHFEEDHNVWCRTERGDFDYSDGYEVELRIKKVIEESFDRSCSSLELHRGITDWPTRYHLDTRRSNLLKPLRSLLRGKVLEIGAGMGAITRYLGECGANVVAVEGSIRRASIAAARCADLPNVDIIADNISNVPVLGQFDVVTLIGVLEYARKYFPSTGADPVDALIEHARSHLAPGGILILAIENQLGLKYFAGAIEDHYGVPMVGIEDRYDDRSPVTFGRNELSRRLSHGGFSQQQWWFPFPDYKLPTSLVSDRAINHNVDFSGLISESVSSDYQISSPLSFSLEKAWGPVVNNGLLGELSNSFLVVGSQAELAEHDVLAIHYGSPRRPSYNKEVRFEWREGDVGVVRNLLCERKDAPESSIISIQLENEPFVAGRSWQWKLKNFVSEPGWTLADWVAWGRTWLEALLDHAGLPLNVVPEPSTSISGNLADAIPRNLIVRGEGDYVFFDQEWRLPGPMELGFLIYRAISISLFDVSVAYPPQGRGSVSRYMLYKAFVDELGWSVSSDTLIRYKLIEDDIQREVADVSTLPLAALYQPIPSPTTFSDMQVENVRELKSQYAALSDKHHIAHYEAQAQLKRAEKLQVELSALIEGLRSLND